MIEDIKSFMKDIEMLNKKIEAQDKIINTQALEIARLKEINKHLKEQLEILLEDNNQLEEIRIKAIEKITDDRYSPIERLMLIKAILGDKE